ncbi:MAG: hypothetical protein WDN72_10930 [Alphaproteobacteria bacterium]
MAAPAEPKTDAGSALPAPAKPHAFVRDNGPRIVGTMKFLPDAFLFLSGLKDTNNTYFRSAAALMFMTSRSILMTYGTKNKKPQEPGATGPVPGQDDPSLWGKLKFNAYKVTHPRQYPVEAGAGIAMTAGITLLFSAGALMRTKETFRHGLLEMAVGGLTALAEGNVLFRKERIRKKGEGRPDSLLQKFKDQPVMLSGVTQAGVSMSQIGLGVMTLKSGRSWYYLAAGSIYTLADLIYAFFVRKNEFHVQPEQAPAASQAVTAAAVIPAPEAEKGKPSPVVQSSRLLDEPRMAHTAPAVAHWPRS